MYCLCLFFDFGIGTKLRSTWLSFFDSYSYSTPSGINCQIGAQLITSELAVEMGNQNVKVT